MAIAYPFLVCTSTKYPQRIAFAYLKEFIDKLQKTPSYHLQTNKILTAKAKTISTPMLKRFE